MKNQKKAQVINKVVSQAFLFFIIWLLGVTGNSTFAKEVKNQSTKYLYDQCNDALTNENFSDSFCANYIKAFLDGYTVAGYMIATEHHKKTNEEDIVNCNLMQPDNIKDLTKEYISWVDKKKNTKKIQYDVFRADYSETLGSMFLDTFTCLEKNEKKIRNIK